MNIKMMQKLNIPIINSKDITYNIKFSITMTFPIRGSYPKIFNITVLMNFQVTYKLSLMSC